MIDFSYSKKNKATFKKLADKWDEIFQREDFLIFFLSTIAKGPLLTKRDLS